MSALKEVTITIAPKIDPRKAALLQQNLEKLFNDLNLDAADDKANALVKKHEKAKNKSQKESRGLLRQAGALVAGTQTAIAGGMYILNQVEDIINKPKKTIEGLIDFGDKLADTAKILGTTAARAIQVTDSLSAGGAKVNTTVELMNQFAATMRSRGTQGDISENFMQALSHISKTQGPARAGVIERYFGTPTVLGLDEVLRAFGKWDETKISANLAHRYGHGVENAKQSAIRQDRIRFHNQLEGIEIVNQRGLGKALESTLQLNWQKDLNELKTTNAIGIQRTNEAIAQMRQSIASLLKCVVNLGMMLENNSGLFSKLGHFLEVTLTNIANMLTKIVNGLSNIWPFNRNSKGAGKSK